MGTALLEPLLLGSTLLGSTLLGSTLLGSTLLGSTLLLDPFEELEFFITEFVAGIQTSFLFFFSHNK
ncbi:MAG: hypothetical protein F2816_04095, partial [Actinobacteria bacterium]|nr:hypothetical protein [Actinomycetota bacterium]